MENKTVKVKETSYVWQANDSAKIGKHLKRPSRFQ